MKPLESSSPVDGPDVSKGQDWPVIGLCDIELGQDKPSSNASGETSASLLGPAIAIDGATIAMVYTLIDFDFVDASNQFHVQGPYHAPRGFRNGVQFQKSSSWMSY